MTMEPIPDGAFDAAAAAVLSGDASGLIAQLRRFHLLIQQRSKQPHHATLLHYIAANGVGSGEDYPGNALEILDILLAAGADVHATADLYGGGATTLGLVATSIHPARAGVLIPLLHRLLAAGADIDAIDAAGNRQRAVIGCLANGRPEAAHYLAQRGASLDLEGAAGLGRLDLVENFFAGDGNLKDGAHRGQLAAGLIWASEYGHAAVVSYLIDRGADPAEAVNGMHALDMAVIGGHLDTIRLLLRHGAPLESRNRYGGTPLGMAFWVMGKREPVHIWPRTTVDDWAVIRLLVDAGAQGGHRFARVNLF